MPTSLAATLLIPPSSSMASLAAADVQQLATGGQLYGNYAQAIDRESAHEIISSRIAAAQEATTREVEETDTDTRADAKEAARMARAHKRAAQRAERERVGGGTTRDLVGQGLERLEAAQ